MTARSSWSTTALGSRLISGLADSTAHAPGLFSSDCAHRVMTSASSRLTERMTRCRGPQLATPAPGYRPMSHPERRRLPGDRLCPSGRAWPCRTRLGPASCRVRVPHIGIPLLGVDVELRPGVRRRGDLERCPLGAAGTCHCSIGPRALPTQCSLICIQMVFARCGARPVRQRCRPPSRRSAAGGR